jgi:hypothetical protein
MRSRRSLVLTAIILLQPFVPDRVLAGSAIAPSCNYTDAQHYRAKGVDFLGKKKFDAAARAFSASISS